MRGYDWNNADILDWFFSGERLGYPNISMWKDAKSDELEQDGDGRIEDLGRSGSPISRPIMRYILSQFLFVPIYQPAQQHRLQPEDGELPAQGPRPRFRQSQTISTSK